MTLHDEVVKTNCLFLKLLDKILSINEEFYDGIKILFIYTLIIIFNLLV